MRCHLLVNVVNSSMDELIDIFMQGGYLHIFVVEISMFGLILAGLSVPVMTNVICSSFMKNTAYTFGPNWHSIVM